MPVNPFSKTKVASEAKSLVNQTLAKVSAQDQAKVKDALAQVASQNGDKFLNKAEAQMVADAFEKAAAAGPLTGAALDGVLTQVDAQAKAMAKASNVDGLSAHFSFNESLEAKLCAELYDVVDRAKGKPVEINMMIFEFQSDEVEKTILDIAKNNPNVTLRVVADSTQASTSGGNALPVILKEKLPNVEVKFKKDFPYIWSSKDKRPVYNHGATQGLNHHKGFAATIDGVPDKLVSGSFNWSDTADEKNYEDLFIFKSGDASTRRGIEQYQDEFAAYFNSNEATLSPNAFSNFKKQQWNDMTAKNGVKPTPFTPLPDDAYAVYTPRQNTTSFDVNGFRPEDDKGLNDLVGTKLAQTIRTDRTKYGRFASLEELKQRVSGVAKLPAEKLAALEASGLFGSGQVSANNSSVDELKRAGLSATLAKAVVAYREAHGDFEAVEDLAKVPGMTASALNSVARNLNVTDVEAFFNSRPFGAAVGGTGYGSGGTRTSAVMGADGAVTQAAASVTVAATDLFNRAKAGDTVCVAMYGISASSKEFQAMAAAAKRGVTVRVVVNDDYTEPATKAIKALKAQGFDIDVRIQKAKTMHEKFGVVGNDVFFGSANFSESSSTKHSEDRFSVKNSAEIAEGFQARFDALWAKSKDVA